MNNFIEIRQIDRDAVSHLVRNLEDFEKDKAIKSGLGDAGNVFKTGGKSRLKRRMKSGSKGVTGNLMRSFHVRVKKGKPGVLIGFKQGTGGGSHSHLVDRGTDERYWKARNYKNKQGTYRKSTGRGIGNAFWIDTESQDHPKAMDKLYVGIERAVNRISSRR